MDDINILFDLIKNKKSEEFINYLKEHDDIDVNIRDTSNNYLLNYAIIQNNLSLVSILIHRGAKLDITDHDGRSIIFILIKFEFIKILELLIYFNRTNIGISLVDIKDKNGNIPLHYAIVFKNEKAVDILLDADSDVRVIDNKKNNSLHYAVKSGNINICKKILEKDLDIDAKNKFGENALHLAADLKFNDIGLELIKKGININSQNDEHEYSALHYSVNNNNIDFVKILMENDVNPNKQDFLGNTVLHYIIFENNFFLLEYFLNSDIKDKINMNLFNYESKLPIHILLQKELNDYDKFIDLFIENSNLNFSDNDKNTPLHLLCMKSLWFENKEILKRKKLNIFINNGENMRPIDYIDKNNIDDFINIVVESYLYTVRNTPKIWNNKLDNRCKKELYFDQLTSEEKKELRELSKNIGNKEDVCKIIIEKKIRDLYQKKYYQCDNLSYPIRKEKKCFSINQGNEISFCTFTGISIDILIGLVYLLKKHKNACSIIETGIDNSGSETKDIFDNLLKDNFLSFEILWKDNRLFFKQNFDSYLDKCIKGKQRFIIIPLGIEIKKGNHSNYIIYDKKKKEVERFEPYGSRHPYEFNYNRKSLDKLLQKKFQSIDPEIILISPEKYIPKISFQFLDSFEYQNKKIGDPEGFCAIWTIWYTDQRLTYPDIDRKKLIKKIIKYIKIENISYKNLIRNYSSSITNMRDDILNKAGININDWLNDQYTMNDIEIIIKEISTIIKNIKDENK